MGAMAEPAATIAAPGRCAVAAKGPTNGDDGRVGCRAPGENGASVPVGVRSSARRRFWSIGAGGAAICARVLPLEQCTGMGISC
jgi:hypothetical protein